MNTDYRHEWKHPINYGDLLLLRQRLRAESVAQQLRGEEGTVDAASLNLSTMGSMGGGFGGDMPNMGQPPSGNMPMPNSGNRP